MSLTVIPRILLSMLLAVQYIDTAELQCRPTLLHISDKKSSAFDLAGSYIVRIMNQIPDLGLLTYWQAVKHKSQIRPQLSVASPTNRPQPKVIITEGNNKA